MGLALVVRSTMLGDGIWAPFESIGAFWPSQFASGIGAGLLGLLSHLGLSFGLGTGVGRGVDGDDSFVFGLVSGLTSGLVVWALVTFAVVPSTNPSTQAWVTSHPTWFWLGIHLLYGGVVGVLLPPLDRMVRG